MGNLGGDAINSISIKLKDYQREAVDKMWRKKRICNFCDMGL